MTFVDTRGEDFRASLDEIEPNHRKAVLRELNVARARLNDGEHQLGDPMLDRDGNVDHVAKLGNTGYALSYRLEPDGTIGLIGVDRTPRMQAQIAPGALERYRTELNTLTRAGFEDDLTAQQSLHLARNRVTIEADDLARRGGRERYFDTERDRVALKRDAIRGAYIDLARASASVDPNGVLERTTANFELSGAAKRDTMEFIEHARLTDGRTPPALDRPFAEKHTRRAIETYVPSLRHRLPERSQPGDGPQLGL